MLLASLAWAFDFPADQAAAPPMGWNSWNCYGTTVTAEGVLAQAQAIADSGLREKGFVYVVIDDGWQGERGGELGGLQGDADFPDVGALADAVRALGLRLGIYSTPWDSSYGGNLGSGGYELADAWQWADWNIRYLKYDWSPIDPPRVRTMRDALASTGAPIVYSLSNNADRGWGPTYAGEANLWRTTLDITDSWESLSEIGFGQAGWEDLAGPGHWNDPDMMVLGWVGWGADQHPTALSPDEQKLHVSLWALLAAPLMLGADLSRLDEATLALLSNDAVLEVNQDPAGIQASRRELAGDVEIWARPLASGAWALGAFNRGETVTTTAVGWSWAGFAGPQPVLDLWDGADLGVAESVEVEIPAHGVRLLRVGEALPVAPAFVGPLEERAEVGTAFGYTVLTTGTRPVSLAATGLPEGLALDGNLLTGTPTTAGSYDIELTATNDGGSTVGSLRLEVEGEGPWIGMFAPSEAEMAPGQGGILRWVSSGADEVRVEPDIGAVAASEEYPVSPSSTTTWTLTATAGDLTRTRTLTVEVPAVVPLGLRENGHLRPQNDEAEWQGWGSAADDASVDGAPLSVGGTSAQEGIGTHAASRLVYALGGHYRLFTATVGVDDEKASAQASVAFSVSGDGVLLWSSGVLGAADLALPLSVDVSGVEELVLEVSDVDGSVDDDHADWITPSLVVGEDPPVDSGGADSEPEAKDSAWLVEEELPEGCGCAHASPLPLLVLPLLRRARRVRT